MTKLDERLTGYVKGKVGEDVVYEGYILNGEKFITRAFGEPWYKGLLSEVEILNTQFGNPAKYAYSTYGERYLQHMRDFTRRVLERVGREYGEVEEEFSEIPEEHVREILGLPEEEQPKPKPKSRRDRSIVLELLNRPVVVEGKSRRRDKRPDLKRLFSALGYRTFYINGEGNSRLEPYLRVCENIKHGDTSVLFIFPRFSVLVGRMDDTHFVAVPPGTSVALDTLRNLHFQTVPEEQRLHISVFKDVGVPVGKVHLTSESVFRISVFRHIGEVVKVETDKEMDLDSVKTSIGRYRRWVREVETSLVDNTPSHLTRPAWQKIVMAHLDDYPHPEDFERAIQVFSHDKVNIPKCDIV
ncbi:MAG: hypothetical protein GXO29_06755 [Thermotogae bacterium]|nr:hypothetical protein [Thermotogota bacterium]